MQRLKARPSSGPDLQPSRRDRRQPAGKTAPVVRAVGRWMGSDELIELIEALLDDLND